MKYATEEERIAAKKASYLKAKIKARQKLAEYNKNFPSVREWFKCSQESILKSRETPVKQPPHEE